MKGFSATIATAALLGLPFPSTAQDPQQEIHRALIQRDQQAAEFAARARGDAAAVSRLQALHEQQRREPPLAPEFLPYQRQRMADERALVFSPPVFRSSGTEPELKRRKDGSSGSDPELVLPLPGGRRPGVDPVLPQGLPY